MKKLLFIFSFLLLFGFAKAADSELKRLLKNISEPGDTSFRQENERLRAEIAFKDGELEKKNYIFWQCSIAYMQLFDYATRAKVYIEHLEAQVQQARVTRTNAIENMQEGYSWKRWIKPAFIGAVFASAITYGCMKFWSA